MSTLKRICVFCGSSVGSRPQYAASARELGRMLAERGLGVVFGGGKVGLMGVLADAALAAGGEAIGVIPEALVAREIGHSGLTKLHVVRSMHERKTLMADLADAFIALPGGYGTFEEFFEAVTWTHLGIHQKPCGLLNVDGYYDALLALLSRAVADGFIREANRALVLDTPDVPTLLQKLEAFRPAAAELGIGKAER
ncbi:MAG TPA: TIGR00730 family Rossman fold protein [Terriglobales bacterium]|nr:TIGR00730 family Rossman fold protein [Terriglobales bacterium]